MLRWEKDGDEYRDPAKWPALTVATNATHDTDTTADWYDGLSTDERERLRKIPALAALDPARRFDDQTRDLFLKVLYQAPSVLALVPIQDVLGGRERINTPGTVDAGNWTFRMDKSVADLMKDTALVGRLAGLVADSGRGGDSKRR